MGPGIATVMMKLLHRLRGARSFGIFSSLLPFSNEIKGIFFTRETIAGSVFNFLSLVRVLMLENFILSRPHHQIFREKFFQVKKFISYRLVLHSFLVFSLNLVSTSHTIISSRCARAAIFPK